MGSQNLFKLEICGEKAGHFLHLGDIYWYIFDLLLGSIQVCKNMITKEPSRKQNNLFL